MSNKLKKIKSDSKGVSKLSNEIISKMKAQGPVKETKSKLKPITNNLELAKDLQKQPPKEKGVNMPKFQVLQPDMVHQADLLFLPNDKGYRYLLVVVDCNSRKIAAKPLKNKTANVVKEALINIYENEQLLNLPKRFEVDDGSEFKSVVASYLKSKNVFVRVADPGRHRQQGMVERYNQTIGKELFTYMIAKQLETNEENGEWVANLPKVIDKINKRSHPRKIITESPKCSGDTCNLLKKGDKVRIKLNQPIETTGTKLHGRFRTTDIKYTPRVYEIKEVLIKPNSPPLYLVEGYPTTPYTKEQLKLVA